MEEKLQVLHDALFQETLKNHTSTLEPIQIEKLNQACWKAIQDNEEATFDDLMISTKTYLNLIINFPGLVL